MKRKAYLDQNIIVEIASGKHQQCLSELSAKDLVFVLSPFHWIEAARSPDRSTALKTAEVMERLNSLWLRERRSIQRREIGAWVAGSPGSRDSIGATCKTTSEVATEFSGMKGALAVLTCRSIVDHLWKDGSFRNTMAGAYRSNSESFNQNVRHVAAGQLTNKKESEIWTSWLRSVADEAGYTVTENQFRKADRSFFPSILTEFELAKENWARAVANANMRLSPQRLTDVFHAVVSLPYVDFVVSHDTGFRSLANAIKSRLPFPTATLTSSLEDLKNSS